MDDKKTLIYELLKLITYLHELFVTTYIAILEVTFSPHFYFREFGEFV